MHNDAFNFAVLKFVPTLVTLMRSQKPLLSQLDLARRVGLSQSTVSRIIDGSQLPTRDQVGAICAAISEDRAQRLELLLAWLRDEASAGAVAGIDERHYKLSAVSDQPDSSIPLSLSADLELIAAECVAHEDVRAAVTNLAHVLLRHRAELADAQATVVPFTELPAPKYPAGSRPHSRG
jgi:transcriptional regulator with XRE-family HTH domain